MYSPTQAVPEHELHFDFVRSSGPGGQKVNKTSSKVQLRWHIGGSGAFTAEQKALIRRAAGRRLNADDEIVIAAETERSQFQNRAAVVERLRELVARALTPVVPRVPTRVSWTQKQKRLDSKRRVGEAKRRRKSQPADW